MQDTTHRTQRTQRFTGRARPPRPTASASAVSCICGVYVHKHTVWNSIVLEVLLYRIVFVSTLFVRVQHIYGFPRSIASASARVAERVWLPLEGHGPPEETKLSRYSQPFLKPCIVIPSKPSFV